MSSVTIDSNGNATIAWSQSLYGTPRTGTVTTLIPAGLLIPNTSVIWGEATYSYRPTVGWGLVGTVSMDMIAVDVTDLPPVVLGERVELWGANLPVEELAAAAGTIAYELLCGVSQRVPIELA